MSSLGFRIARYGVIAFVLGATASWTLGPSGSLHAADPFVQRVEEDWEMHLIEPRPESHSPQVTFFTYPSVDNSSCYFQTQMNYAARNDFSGGGFHVAAVDNDSYLDQARSGNRIGLSIDRDTITWTNVVGYFDHKILFAVKDGYGTDWGSFGGPEYLVEMPANSIPNLNDYDPLQSLASVDIGFGKNRVSMIKLKRVRLYYNTGRVETIPVNQNVRQ